MKACLQLQQLFCSRENQLASGFIQQNEKSTSNKKNYTCRRFFKVYYMQPSSDMLSYYIDYCFGADSVTMLYGLIYILYRLVMVVNPVYVLLWDMWQPS